MPKRSLNTSNASGGAAAASKKRRESAAASQNKNVQLAGIINKVELKNFMNHAYLTFDFQPRVNFVTGRNGTGKSALLTGLMVGLGGKAAATNRGSQLSGFIQHGKNVSDIKVTLNNEGIDAYHPEIYGDVISVERKLTRMKDNGCTSDYKIRTSTGKLISSRKIDLTRILDHFNIQVENPVAILNQETSKSFLCSKQPSDVYKFFVKATLLEHMEQNYDKAKVEFDKSMDTLKSKESALPTMEYELKKAEERAEALKSLDKLRTKLQGKRSNLAWAVVAQKEAEHEKMVAKAQGLQKKRPKIEDKLRKAKEDVVAANEKKTEIEERIKAMASDTGKFEPERLQLKTEHNQRKQATRTKIDAAKQVQKDLRRVEGEKKLMQDRVTEIQANSQDDRSAQLRERDEKIERLTKKFRDIEQNHANTKAQMNQATQSLSSLTEKRNEHASNVGELERIKKQRQQKIAELEKVRNNKTARFGRNIPALQEEIEKLVKAGRFKRRPYGPLGAHITMKDMNYVLGAERALGGLMSAFLVDNLADKDLLEATKKRLYTPGERPPAVIHCKYSDRRHDIQRDRAQTNHPTLSDLINIDNDHVFNCIVDEVSPQNMVLVLDPTQARQLMVRSPPAKTYVCYDRKGDEIRGPEPFTVYSNSKTRANFLSANVEEDIRVETQQLLSVSKELTSTQKMLDKVKLEITKTHSDANKHRSLGDSLERQLRKYHKEIEELKNQVIEEETTEDVDALKSDIENLQDEAEKFRANLQQAKQQLDECKAAEKEVEEKLAAVCARIREANHSIDPLKAELGQADEEIDIATNSVNHYDKQLKDWDSKIETQETDMNKFYAEEIERDIGIASQMSQRVEPKKTPQLLQVEIKKIETQLTREEQLKGDADEIRAQVNSLTERYHHAKQQLKQCQLYRQVMKISLHTRRENMFKIKVSTGSTTKLFFATLLHNRNYDGKLEMDHDEQKLEIKVHPSSDQNASNRDLKGLSGGEKSFSTLCFMMSLWESVHSPFRCMDEFDVFMDMVNRRISIKMLLEFAKTNPRHQFIFLTPQDTSQVEVNDFVHIFRMPDPARE